MYFLPQLAAIYYAGQHELKVITDSEEPVGLPIAALIPEISLAIDVCGYEKEASIKEYICKDIRDRFQMYLRLRSLYYWIFSILYLLKE